ncbi:hypothetical protein [Pseudoduganella chitinolytica]|uniref:Uncharacterized protein n=1 Tax=Pseudoduganella chitinolytica TaxID=34070 RepID=A0ABY8BBA5_9BURK|nr:hypothetical protein [Pseudoduganella chitinolytica]WEF33192.1 hypothetical protein PX653_28040 [Pseudoduganella chitinolytica]
MAAEFHIVFDDPTWYEQNRKIVKAFIQSLPTFVSNINDEECWLRGNETGGDWVYGARIFTRPRDINLEISSHPSSIIDDIRELNRFISRNAATRIVDEDGEIIDGYS